jgi:hypothetical protein
VQTVFFKRLAYLWKIAEVGQPDIEPAINDRWFDTVELRELDVNKAGVRVKLIVLRSTYVSLCGGSGEGGFVFCLRNHVCRWKLDLNC